MLSSTMTFLEWGRVAEGLAKMLQAGKAAAGPPLYLKELCVVKVVQVGGS